jgi:hypothetical protein
MKWILDHFQLLVPIAAGLAYWLNQLLVSARGESKDDAPRAGSPGAPFQEPEDDERTRRIQEEIRRKIAERRGGGQPPPNRPAPAEPPMAPPVIAPRPTAQEMPRGLRERLEAKLAEARARAEAAAQERQRQLQDQEMALKAERLAAERRAAEIAAQALAATKPAPSTEEGVSGGSARWSDDMRIPRNLRRAIVLREVLGPPVGLR